MRTFIKFLLIFSGIICFNYLQAQINYGGKPFFVQENMLRASRSSSVFMMPFFDLDSVLREDEINNDYTRGSYRFAHKFYTNINKKRDALLTVLDDGTRVWTLTIMSEGAYSLNFLLENVSFPPGGALYVYNVDHSHVIGKFDSRNVSESRILPIRPVAGESIIVEYSEPAGVDFEGDFTITEVNHDYRDFLRREPEPDKAAYSCMPDAICSEVDERLVRATVLLIVDGSSACSGSLINNANNDETPYVLTAVHCLNSQVQFPKGFDYYETHAGTIVAFFNYHRTICGSDMKATEEMSIAGSVPIAVAEGKDAALIRLNHDIPDHYNPYYAGWSLDISGENFPYVNLHHPSGAVKKYGLYNQKIQIGNYPEIFERQSHWKINYWNIGSTYRGSSGSPLFDNQGSIVGGLTGGISVCNGGNPGGGSDYFFSIYKAWDLSNSIGTLKSALDPNNENRTQLPGLDPFEEYPFKRISNMDIASGNQLTIASYGNPNTGFVFGNSSLPIYEFAEEFESKDLIDIYGAYLYIPPINSSGINNIEVSLYTGSSKPEKLLATTTLNPVYLKYDDWGKGFEEYDKTMNKVATENFVSFDRVFRLHGKFFISYKVPDVGNAKISLYNMEFSNPGMKSTAWMKSNEGWIRSADYSVNQIQTSLAIQVLSKKVWGVKINEIEKTEQPVYFDSSTEVLRLKDPVVKSGFIEVFSITGQMMDKIVLTPNQMSYPLKKQSKGAVVILRITIDEKLYTMKIIC